MFKIRGKCLGGRRGDDFKMQTSEMAFQSKLNNVKVFKIRIKGLEGRRGGDFEEKKCKGYKWHPKINLCRKFQPNRIMGKGSKIGGMVFGKGRWG